MPDDDKAPKFDFNGAPLDDIFQQFFGGEKAGMGGVSSDAGPDTAQARKKAERAAYERKVEEAYGGGRRHIAFPRYLVAIPLLCGLLALVVFARNFFPDKPKRARPRTVTAPAAEALRQAALRNAQNRARAVEASAQARQRVAEATRRAMEIQNRARGGNEISLAAQINGVRVLVPLLAGWSSVTPLERGDDGFRPVMAFAAALQSGNPDTLYAVAERVAEKNAELSDASALFTQLRANLNGGQVLESEPGILTLGIPGEEGAAHAYHVRSYLVVGDGVIRLSVSYPSPPANNGMDGLKYLRIWRGAFRRGNPGMDFPKG